MGRSVSYLNNAVIVLYFPFEGNESNDAGEYDEFLSQMNWDDMIDSLQCAIKRKLPSYYETDKWGNRETRIILENNLCSIGISEYCGLCSLSVAPKNNICDESWGEEFALHHAGQIEKTLRKVLDDLGLKRLNKMGTFSNGEAVFQKA
jgi:hypothetical protein